MMLRRYHNTAPAEPAPDGTAPDRADDAPQPKAAGRSRTRSKTKEG
ncbi:hypothetical protein QEP66_01080 [Streptomyces sp. LB8]|nr:hypothetical protein [Streptomyces sp. LB8]MDN5380724.1 hypothetical protein [Streptomyces sp. LB8]